MRLPDGVNTFAEDRRAEIRAKAAAIGVDEAYLSRLVARFHARVQEDAMLGPIFESALAGRWAEHDRQMERFWASVALNAGTYSGEPVRDHQRLEGVTPAHFGRWLEIFEATLLETAPSPEAVEYLLVRAQRIAASLQIAKFVKLRYPRGGPA